MLTKALGGVEGERAARSQAGGASRFKGRGAAKGHKLIVSIQVMAALGGTSFDVDGFRLQ